jgi:hypothetical protein
MVISRSSCSRTSVRIACSAPSGEVHFQVLKVAMVVLPVRGGHRSPPDATTVADAAQIPRQRRR